MAEEAAERPVEASERAAERAEELQPAAAEQRDLDELGLAQLDDLSRPGSGASVSSGDWAQSCAQRHQTLDDVPGIFQSMQRKVDELNAQLDQSVEQQGGPVAPHTPEKHQAQVEHQPRSSSDSLYSPEVEQCVRSSVADLEQKLESVLEGVAEDLAAEVGREQQHLMLMQSQVDKQGQTLLREIASLQTRLEQERTQRSFLQTAQRDSKDLVSTQLAQQGKELELLRHRLAQLETPWLVRAMGSLSSLVWGPCAAGAPAAGVASSAAARNGSYQAMPEPADAPPPADAPHVSPSPPAAMVST